MTRVLEKFFWIALLTLVSGGKVNAASRPLPNPILFVTQVPQPADFTSIGSLFGNHTGSIQSAPRGGGLWIRYPDGTLRNLTKAAGFGLEGAQHGNGIAVREPSIHWNGTKAVFSMVVGAPDRRYQVNEFYWQLYEITNFLDPSSTPVITKVPNQPANYNNDPNIRELYYFGNKFNTNTLNNFIHLRESPVTPGLYFGIAAPESGTHSGGQVIAVEAPIAANADFSKLHYYTHRDTSFADDTPNVNHSGLYRNPLPLSDGRIAVVHTAETGQDKNTGTSISPKSRYDFRLKFLVQANGTWAAGETLTPGINTSVTWWSPDELVSYSGPVCRTSWKRRPTS